MQQNGTFSGDEFKGAKKFKGRKKWVLVPEGAAVEIDVTAFACRLVAAEALLNTVDADDEIWTVPESDKSPSNGAKSPTSPKPKTPRKRAKREP